MWTSQVAQGASRQKYVLGYEATLKASCRARLLLSTYCLILQSHLYLHHLIQSSPLPAKVCSGVIPFLLI